MVIVVVQGGGGVGAAIAAFEPVCLSPSVSSPLDLVDNVLLVIMNHAVAHHCPHTSNVTHLSVLV